MLRKPIKSDSEIEVCVQLQSTVRIWMNNEVEDVGVIEKYDNDTIQINGDYYIRNNCVIEVINQNFVLIK